MWVIRKIVSKGDYLYAVVPEHPKATVNHYVLLHRVVVENHINRLLNSNEVVHHIDGNRKNNIISNLQLMTFSEHSTLHKSIGEKMCTLKCPYCGKVFILPYRQTYLGKKVGKVTCCSKSCRARFWAKVKREGQTEEISLVMEKNIINHFNSLAL